MTEALTKIAVVLALLAALLFGEQYIEGLGYDRRAAEDSAAMETQKNESKTLLAQLTQERADNATALANLTNLLEKAREDLQFKNSADLAKRLPGPSLQYVTTQAAGCGRGGGSTEGPAPGAAPDAGTTVVQLPKQISDDLWQLAADAQSLAIDYGVLHAYVHNPKLVCELRR